MQMAKTKTIFILPQLPYRENALEPTISARTISFHYGEHHAGYVKTLNKLVDGTSFAGRPLEEIVLQTAKDPTSCVSVFRWPCVRLAPNAGFANDRIDSQKQVT